MSLSSSDSSKGFTLVELIIVIGMIGVLAGVVITVLNPSLQRQRAKEVIRIENVAKIAQALEAYNAAEEGYPISQDAFISSGYIKSWPSETGVTYRYNYICEGSFCIGCIDVPMASDPTRYYKYVTNWDEYLTGGTASMPKVVLKYCSNTQTCDTNDIGTCLTLDQPTPTPIPIDTAAPVRSNGYPTTGTTLPSTTTSTLVKLNTDENATCKYILNPGQPYSAMTAIFDGAGTTLHTVMYPVANNSTYDFYVKCSDSAGNVNTDDYQISFSVAAPADTTPPVRSNQSPTPGSSFPGGTTSVVVSLNTNEKAACKYSKTPGVAYASMPFYFTTTGSTSHSFTYSGLTSGQYDLYVRCSDSPGNVNTDDLMYSFKILTAADTTPPVRSGGQPTGTLPDTTTNIFVSVNTNENATCKYSTVPGMSYGSMTLTFTTTGGTFHNFGYSVSPGRTYNFYVRCSDTAGNANPDDYLITFSTASADTTPPVRTNGYPPTGTLLAYTTTQVQISLQTDENANCKYATSAGISYSVMTYFSTTGSDIHRTTINTISGTTYNIYVKCSDMRGNINMDDFLISFSVDSAPPPPPAPSCSSQGGTCLVKGSVCSGKWVTASDCSYCCIP
ncbi:hypothetical protein A2716_00210 [candidate division WWE3 bacterium RIFCSPHIGHO2_01_FULL_40_23]|uniref:Type II secretion system protein GspG C-terminal domain-containing protein n=1 Tax=candidate division WWE3 bacterium RIFCSPLOWO2_01_FULL_41_18 TaxID=1802625 RepID=A0A1F4VEQ9_UNCKA|nr:MAG: hypothetical protein A2716_00210 [candidate division WWE3 bacterium RIFCSPHIGHO2_01_FULL_40_23]OGC55420.1 MAG: hypothetical protein A3A78_00480 [candidate division WWE3 bacterium RIFCSPLOWO2_01_FULL_41_18]